MALNLEQIAFPPSSADGQPAARWRPSLMLLAWLGLAMGLACVGGFFVLSAQLQLREAREHGGHLHRAVGAYVAGSRHDRPDPGLPALPSWFVAEGLIAAEVRDDDGRVLSQLDRPAPAPQPSRVLPTLNLDLPQGLREADGWTLQWSTLPGGLRLVTAVDLARVKAWQDEISQGFTLLGGAAWLLALLFTQAVVWPHVLALRALARWGQAPRGSLQGEVRPRWWHTRELSVLIDTARRLVRAEQVRDELAEMTYWSSLSAGEGQIVCDEHGRIVWANNAAARLVGADGGPRSLSGLPVERLLLPAERSRLNAALARLGEHEKSHDEPARLHDLLGLHGDRVPVSSRLSVGRFGRRRLASHYLTDRREELRRLADLEAARAKAERASALKSDFLAAVSHDIRTSLNGTLGMIDLVRDTPLDADQQHLLDTARGSGELLRGLLNDLLDLSKIEAGRLQLEQLPFDPADQLTHCVRPFEAVAREGGKELRWQVGRLPERIVGDALRICQVLTNLVDNAIKFTPAGGAIVVALDGGCGAEARPGTRFELQLRVTDSGPGVPLDQVGRIFDPFRQASAAIARHHGGTGLGLPLSRRLCEMMGGDLDYAPAPSGGSVFTARVRCEVGEPAVPPAEAGAGAGAQDAAVRPLAGRRVLIADDNRVNQVLLERWLQAAGARTLRADDGAQALQLAMLEPLDAVLMDVSMPVTNGQDAARSIRSLATAPERRHLAALPIIGVSAHAMSGDREACLQAGMNDYLTKPLRRQDLLERLAHWIAPPPPGPAAAAPATPCLQEQP